MYQSYDPQTLHKLQNTELEIYKYFRSVCQQHNIPYFALGGTAIGTIRHHGFIPWDDDMDIALLRADYDRLLSILAADRDSPYQLISPDIDPSFPLTVARLQKKGTTFVDHSLKDASCHLGIFLDLFPVDNLTSDPRQRRRQIRRTWFWSKLMILRALPHPTLPLTGIKKSFAAAVCTAIHYSLRILHISPRFLYRSYRRHALRYNKDSSCRDVILFSTTFPWRTIMPKENIFPSVSVPFADTVMELPSCYDAFLTNQFGDYMTPPPQQRKNHYPYRLDFGEK